MNRIINVSIFILIFNISCSEYLDIVPDNVATLDYAFYDRASAERFLATCYSYLTDFGNAGLDVAIMGSDELCVHREENLYAGSRFLNNFHTYRIIRGQQNVSNPLVNYWEGGNAGRNLFQGIRDCNIFLENIQKVGSDLQEWERARWISEVKFLKAYYHYYLMRMYGPIPIIRENLPISADIESVRISREPIDVCVEYIVNLIDSSISDLPLRVTNESIELGRITQPIALAIKAEILVTAASPLFNGNQMYSNFKDENGISLINTEFDSDKWKIAMNAAKNAIDTALLAGISLYELNGGDNLSDKTKIMQSCRGAFTDRWNNEVIWGLTKNSMNDLQLLALPYFNSSNIQNIGSDPIISATLRIDRK